MQTRLFASLIYTPFETIPNGVVDYDIAGVIETVSTKEETTDLPAHTLDLSGKILLPGLIDIHTHGGFGVAFGEGDLEAGLYKYSRQATRTGVTGFVPTITGPDIASISKTIRDYVRLLDEKRDWPGALPLGLHLEGPFLNPQKHGAFDPDWLRLPLKNDLQRLMDAGGKWIKHVSMAPELDGAFAAAEMLRSNGITVSLGHSNTDYETAQAALEGPFTHVTHTFNAQSPLHHRAPGVVGAVLASKQGTAEIIGDGIHVHPAVVQILFRCLGAERVVLITDAMPGAGLPDGNYKLMGKNVTVQNGKATLPDGTIAGSAATLSACLRVLVQEAGISWKDAARTASFNPAQVIRESSRIGSIEAGKQANFVVLDRNFNVHMTIVNGKLVYHKEG